MRKITKGLRLPHGAGNSILKVEVDLQNQIFYFYLSGELIQEERFFEPIYDTKLKAKVVEVKETLAQTQTILDEMVKLSDNSDENQMARYLKIAELEDDYESWKADDKLKLREIIEGNPVQFLDIEEGIIDNRPEKGLE